MALRSLWLGLGVMLVSAQPVPAADLNDPPHLTPVRSAPIPGVRSYADWIRVSPDGRWIAEAPVGSLSIVSLAGEQGLERGTLVHSVATNFSGLGGAGEADSYAWDADSGGLHIGVGQHGNVVDLRPARISIDGVIHDQPPLSHPNGALDGLLYVGHEGLAVARFGTRPMVFSPDFSVQTATMAFVDTTEGRVLEALTYSELVTSWCSERNADPDRIGLWDADAVMLADGRMSFMGRMSCAVPEGHADAGMNVFWIVWTQGETPRRLESLNNHPNTVTRGGFALAPDGRTAVITTVLAAHYPCPADATCDVPVIPAAGRYAALVSVETGQVLWRLEGRTDQVGVQYRQPAFHPNGQIVAIQAPPGEGAREIVLVRVERGEVIAVVETTPHAQFGFTSDGASLWVVEDNEVLALYDVPVL